MCSGRIDPDFILEAFRMGADGVLVLGCSPGNCHYKNGNLAAMKRITLLKTVLGHYGVDEERVALDWISAGEGEKFAAVVQAMVAKIRKMGPLLIMMNS
jgi:F420-non-reducing hydrogenase iron-sulfur subunit